MCIVYYVLQVLIRIDVTTYLVRQSRLSLLLFMLSQLYGGPCSAPQEPRPGGGQPEILFLWLNKGVEKEDEGIFVNAEHYVSDCWSESQMQIQLRLL